MIREHNYERDVEIPPAGKRKLLNKELFRLTLFTDNSIILPPQKFQ